MKSLLYFFKRLRQMDFSAMRQSIRRVAHRSNRSRVRIFWDMCWCGVRYLAGYRDYEVFGFEQLSGAQRRTVITRGINNRYVRQLNGRSFVPEIDDKSRMLLTFAPFINRRSLDLRESDAEGICTFIQDCHTIVVKPVDRSCGYNIEVIRDQAVGDYAALYEQLMRQQQFLAEEYVQQHPMLAALYPHAVNTLRAVTITRGQQTSVAFCCLRMGSNGNVVDNFNHGGLFAPVDDDGVIRTPAVRKDDACFTAHPDTDAAIVGFEVPFFRQTLAYVRRLALSYPSVGYIGWDIAITATGPTLIEANSFPGHDVYQSLWHARQHLNGLRPHFDQLIRELSV